MQEGEAAPSDQLAEEEKMEEDVAEEAAGKDGEGEEEEEGEGKVARKRASAGEVTPSKKKRRPEDSTQLLNVLLSSPSLSPEQVLEQIEEELDSIAQVRVWGEGVWGDGVRGWG